MTLLGAGLGRRSTPILTFPLRGKGLSADGRRSFKRRARADSGLVVCWDFMFVTSLVDCGYVVVIWDGVRAVGSRWN